MNGQFEQKALQGFESPLERDTVKKALDDFANDTTLHGLRYIANSSHILLKLCWLVISITFSVLFIIQTLAVINDYRAYPYSTKIDLISRPSLNFPSVTVCNSNRMRRSQLADTRFEGLIEIDGGTSGADYDYSWWFSSGFWNAFSSSQALASSANTDSASDSAAANSTSASEPSATGSPASETSSSSTGGGRRKRRSVNTGPKLSLKELMLLDRALDPMGPKAAVRGPDGHPQPQRSRHNRGTSRGQPATLSRRERSALSSGFLDMFSWFDQYQDSDFIYYDDGWDVITSENDWVGFYQHSLADDYSDLIDVINPTSDELAEYGHQLEDFVLQCTFDRRQCNIRYTISHATYSILLRLLELSAIFHVIIWRVSLQDAMSNWNACHDSSFVSIISELSHMFGQALAQWRTFSFAVARSSRLHSFWRSGHLSRCCMVCSEVPQGWSLEQRSMTMYLRFYFNCTGFQLDTGFSLRFYLLCSFV